MCLPARSLQALVIRSLSTSLRLAFSVTLCMSAAVVGSAHLLFQYVCRERWALAVYLAAGEGRYLRLRCRASSDVGLRGAARIDRKRAAGKAPVQDHRWARVGCQRTLPLKSGVTSVLQSFLSAFANVLQCLPSSSFLIKQAIGFSH